MADVTDDSIASAINSVIGFNGGNQLNSKKYTGVHITIYIIPVIRKIFSTKSSFPIQLSFIT